MRALRWPRCWLVLWGLAVFGVIVLSLVPPPPLAMASPPGSDKVAHFLAYFALAFGAIQIFARPRWLVFVALGLIAMGVALEFAQGALMPGLRQRDALDALANSTGVLAGMAFWRTRAANGLAWLEACCAPASGRASAAQ